VLVSSSAEVCFGIRLLSILMKCPSQRSRILFFINYLTAVISDFLFTSALLTFIVQFIRGITTTTTFSFYLREGGCDLPGVCLCLSVLSVSRITKKVDEI